MNETVRGLLFLLALFLTILVLSWIPTFLILTYLTPVQQVITNMIVVVLTIVLVVRYAFMRANLEEVDDDIRPE